MAPSLAAPFLSDVLLEEQGDSEALSSLHFLLS
jgi:hypothetical protein